MSNTKPVAKKTVSELVDLIDNIVTEAVAVKKQEWLNEQAKLNNDKTKVLESKLASLEAKVQKITEGKK